ncbi:MAG TPA: alpha/beta hydrolase-fold protein [Chloroflexota bacterium]|nr:alpha/beta hydrolase-fold protein [Chloroflexota bacterium]
MIREGREGNAKGIVWQWVVIWGGLIWWLVGCGGQTAVPVDAAPLPTSVWTPTAVYTPRFTAVPPATLTPHPTSSATPIIPTDTPTVTPTPSPTPRIQPTFPLTVTAPYLDEPPAVVPCDGEGFLFRSRFPSRVAGPWRSYHVYLPPCYGQDGRTYPVLYLLPGSIQEDDQWLNLGLAWHADGGIGDGRYPPFIAIMPAANPLGNNLSGGPYSLEAVIVEELLPYVEANYCAWADPAGRSIGGISRGGYWALMVAFRHEGLVTAVAGHSSSLRLKTDPAPYNPLANYADADRSQLRIWLDWGEEDFLRRGQEDLDRLLTAAGIPHQTTVNPGGHNEDYWATHLVEYLDWHTAVWPPDRTVYPPCE